MTQAMYYNVTLGRDGENIVAVEKQ